MTPARTLRLGVLLLLATVLSVGCRKMTGQQAQAPTNTASPTQKGPAPKPPVNPPPRPGGGGGVPGGGGGVMAVRTAAERQRAANDLKQIGLFYKQYELENSRPPANQQEFISYIQRDGRKIADEINKGIYLVYWNVGPNSLPAGASNTVLAYDVDVPMQGGWVVMADGSQRRVTAQEFASIAKPGQ